MTGTTKAATTSGAKRTKTSLPSAHVKFSTEIIEKIYGPKLRLILDGPNPPTTVAKLAEHFRATHHVGTASSTIAEWLQVLDLAPKTRVEWGNTVPPASANKTQRVTA